MAENTSGPVESSLSGGEIILAQADAGQSGNAEPQALVQANEATAVDVAATGGDAIAIPPDFSVPGQGERVTVDVPAAAEVQLLDEAFNPSNATYAVDGNDLVITLANGGVLILGDFFVAGGTPATLSVLNGPEVPAPQLLAQAESVPAGLDQQLPAAGTEEPAGGVQSAGGGANFEPYVAGSIGAGLDPTGPLGPTSLSYTANFPEPESDPDLLGSSSDDGGPEEPTEASPVITLRSEVKAIIAEENKGFNPASTDDLPPLDGRVIPDSEINGVDQRNLTLDQDREVFVTFESETSRSVDTILAYDIGADGSIVNTRIVFAGLDASVVPVGTTVSLGVVEAGTQFGFALVNDAYRDHADLLGDGRLEFRNADGGPAKITDETPPVLVHVADDGTETVIDERVYFTADDSQDTDNNNALNPDGLGHVVSGWNAAEGSLVIGFEDGDHPRDPDPYRIGRDNDFDDGVISVSYGPVTNHVAYYIDAEGGLLASITDADSTQMRQARIWIRDGLAGDSLSIDPSIADGTNIDVRVEDGQIRMFGVDSIENYEKVISAITLQIDSDNALVGDRVIAARVVDVDGNASDNARTTISITDELLAGAGDGNGPDRIIGTSDGDGTGTIGDDVIAGRDGDDFLRGRSGDDFIDGGRGDDFIDAGPGDDIIVGSSGSDVIIGGSGADTFRYTGLSDGLDVVRDFNASEGDVLDLQCLFQQNSTFDPATSSLSDFLRVVSANVDSDGKADDARLEVDLDGSGTDHQFVAIMNFVEPQGLDGSLDSVVIMPGSHAETAIT